MKIPKYIDKLLEKRAKAALDFISCDSEVKKWLDKNDIEVSRDDISSGACSMYEPYTSIANIRDCILAKENEHDGERSD